jgi:hypothetical protein
MRADNLSIDSEDCSNFSIDAGSVSTRVYIMQGFFLEQRVNHCISYNSDSLWELYVQVCKFIMLPGWFTLTVKTEVVLVLVMGLYQHVYIQWQ